MLKLSLFLLTLLTILPCSITLAQTTDSPSSPTLTTEAEQTLEDSVLIEINRVRSNPIAYSDWLASLRQYYQGNVLQLPSGETINTQEGLTALEEAIAFLRTQTPLTPITSTEQLNIVAQRILKNPERVTTYPSSSTNGSSAELIVMQLIIDDGIPDRPNRSRILQPELVNNGIACQSTEDNSNLCVITYEQNSDSSVTLDPPQNTTPSQLILEKDGVLESGDQQIASDNSLYDLYPVQARQGQSMIITLESDDFDTYLAVMDVDNNIIDQNDDIQENISNSQLIITFTKEGTYYIIVNSYDPQGMGAYKLRVENRK